MMNLFKKREYQVVLEFHGDDPENFERVIALEEKLEEALTSGEVDGNDVGQGIVNIFVITKDPKRCFEEAMRILRDSDPAPCAAGYRDVEKEDYIRLWPKGEAGLPYQYELDRVKEIHKWFKKPQEEL